MPRANANAAAAAAAVLGPLIVLLCCAAVPARAGLRLGFGSCNRVHRPQPMWDVVVRANPDVWIWGGDNIYADQMRGWATRSSFPKPSFVPATPSRLRELYAEQREKRGYKALVELLAARRAPGSPPNLIATWDDHDYGVNDGDRFYEHREESQQIFLDFVDEPHESPRRKQSGVYAHYDYPACGLSDNDNECDASHGGVRVILLDVRFNKDPYQGFHSDVGDLLGEEQWEWLEDTLAHSTARVNIIVSGIQILTEFRELGECWNRFPPVRARLLDMIFRHNVSAPLLVSGDIHMAELLEARCGDGDGGDGSTSTLVELTSSGMTHSWNTLVSRAEISLGRVWARFGMAVFQTVMPAPYLDHGNQPAVFMGRNAALIDIDWERDTVSLRVVDVDGTARITAKYSFQELDPKHASAHTTCRPVGGVPSRARLAVGWALLVLCVVVGPLVLVVVLVRRAWRAVRGGVFARPKRE